jgi:hypothetical protein
MDDTADTAQVIIRPPLVERRLAVINHPTLGSLSKSRNWARSIPIIQNPI